MTFAHLLDAVTWPDLKAAIIWAYPDEKDSLGEYRIVLARLKQLQPAPSRMRIVITETFQEAVDDKPVMEVIGRDGSLNRDQEDFQHLCNSGDDAYADAETNWSITFRSWEEWLGMQIDASTIDQLSPSQIVAHCLWEMTFHGFEQSQVQGTLEEFLCHADEMDSMTDEEKAKHLIPADEVFKRLRTDD